MTQLTPRIEREGLCALLEVDGRRFKVQVSGQAETESKLDLDRFFEQVHAQAAAAGCGSIVVDLKALQFMSSSCFKSFVTWIRCAQQLAPAVRYQIVFAYNPNIRWQRASLSALTCFSSETVAMQV